jgi:hypothetical protein
VSTADEVKVQALEFAVRLSDPTQPIEEVLHKANTLAAWLGGPAAGASLMLVVAPNTYEQNGTGHTPTKFSSGGKVQLTDTQQVTLTVQAVDSKGFPTTDANLTWESADPNIVSLQPSADSMSCLVVAGAPGLGCVVTVSDGDRNATESFDVVGGGIATLQIQVGTPEDQPTPPAP